MYQVPLSDHLKTGKGEELYKKAKDKAGQLHASGENVALASIHQFSEAKHILDAEKIVKLNAVGFEWDLQKDSYIESWENRYSELMKHKILNGNCRVPKTSPDFPQLGHWVKQMRKYKMVGNGDAISLSHTLTLHSIAAVSITCRAALMKFSLSHTLSFFLSFFLSFIHCATDAPPRPPTVVERRRQILSFHVHTRTNRSIRSTWLRMALEGQRFW
jgi:hypothetical protein